MDGNRKIRLALGAVVGLWLAAATGSATWDALGRGDKTGWDHLAAPADWARAGWEALTAPETRPAEVTPIDHGEVRPLAQARRYELATLPFAAERTAYDVAAGSSPVDGLGPAGPDGGAYLSQPEWVVRLILSLRWGQAQP
jgi:hypothetical protein